MFDILQNDPSLSLRNQVYELLVAGHDFLTQSEVENISQMCPNIKSLIFDLQECRCPVDIEWKEEHLNLKIPADCDRIVADCEAEKDDLPFIPGITLWREDWNSLDIPSSLIRRYGPTCLTTLKFTNRDFEIHEILPLLNYTPQLTTLWLSDLIGFFTLNDLEFVHSSCPALQDIRLSNDLPSERCNYDDCGHKLHIPYRSRLIFMKYPAGMDNMPWLRYFAMNYENLGACIYNSANVLITVNWSLENISFSKNQYENKPRMERTFLIPDDKDKAFKMLNLMDCTSHGK
ncbi:hypothetical protein DFQ28_010624 [Apophysomyces sp. BC1034]|nr:hypothetical protein DFQ28_010624 [Apophysomyces sp. BC1034]